MASRLKLHEEFKELTKLKNVYYNPPTSKKLSYPCIKYSLAGVTSKNADDMNYNSIHRYKVMIIDQDPDSDTHIRILEHFKMSSFDTSYVADNLYHRVITLYY